MEPLPENEELQIDDTESILGTDLESDTVSLTSSIAKGYYEHGRRYQATSDALSFPSDDKQHDSMGFNHLIFLVLESQRKNPFFRSPISHNAQHILDLGTGDGAWVWKPHYHHKSHIYCANAQTNSVSMLPTNSQTVGLLLLM